MYVKIARRVPHLRQRILFELQVAVSWKFKKMTFFIFITLLALLASKAAHSKCHIMKTEQIVTYPVTF